MLDINDIKNDIKFEIEYFWNNSIVYPIKRFIYGIKNFGRWSSIVYNDRWWDYEFLLDVILFKLKDMESHWGVDTNAEKDYEIRDILRTLIQDLEEAIKLHNEAVTVEEIRLAKKAMTKFFSKLDRHLIKFWD